MNGKAAPVLLVVAALAIAAAVILTTRTPTAPVPTAPVEASSSAGPSTGDSAAPASSIGGADAPPLPNPGAVGQSMAQPAASATAPTPVASGAGTPPGVSARDTRSAKPGEAAEAGEPGNIQAEMAVANALAAAGLSTADIKVTTLGSASTEAASPEPEPTAPESTPAPNSRVSRDLNIPVPTGAKVPVVFYDNEPRPVPQQQALDRIAAEFSDTVSNPPVGYSQQEVWEAARKIADERYTVLYGFDAFNQMSMQAAKEALKEKKAAAAATQSTP